jgi:ElaB/YqjD/DUF883 family membrane-anchored ribosome-binding protein
MNTPTADEVLAKLGLQTRLSARDYVFPALGIFGLGMLIGAGIVAVSVPTVREQLRTGIRRAGSKMRDMGEQAREKMEMAREKVEDAAEQIKDRVTGGNGRSQADDFQSMTREQLFERAKSMNVQTRTNMSKNEIIDALNAR